ncbi:MAG: YdcF family protein [Gammaproteobacteria bacterium]
MFEERKPRRRRLLWLVVFVAVIVVLVPTGLRALGSWLVFEDIPDKADAAVVLSGPQYAARLARAADLYTQGVVSKVVINGGRRGSDDDWVYAKGYLPPCPWDINTREMLAVLGVPQVDVVSVHAPDAFDTRTEAAQVADELARRDYRSVVVTTSAYHTRRAAGIWRSDHGEALGIGVAAARRDGYDPETWWTSPKMVRAVMGEVGGYLFRAMVSMNPIDDASDR